MIQRGRWMQERRLGEMDDRKELQQIQEYLGNTLSPGLQTSYSARRYEAC